MQKKLAVIGSLLASLVFGFCVISCDDGLGLVVTPPDEDDDVLKCRDECVPNAMRCIDEKSYVCGFFDADRCSEWSDPLLCQNGCSEGGDCNPTVTCENVCKIEERHCDGADGFEYCTTANDSCLVWSARVACLDGSRCSDGRCLNGVTCEDACPLGTKSCVSLASTRTCIVDKDGCAIWGADESCQAGLQCAEGLCIKAPPTCVDACVKGELGCASETSTRTCTINNDGCAVWGASEACQAGYRCADGLCIKETPTCKNDCTNGSRGCANATSTRLCILDKDGCAVWGASEVCQTGTQCEDGLCVKAPPTCTNDCIKGARNCANKTQYQLCDFYNGKSCTTWGVAQSCDTNKVCDGGACIDVCTNACTAGAKLCEGAGFKTCGDLDKNGCTEWSSITACSHGCENGICKPDPNVWVPKCTTNPCPKVISSLPYRLSSTTKGGVNNIGSYTGCSALSEAGPEEYYVFRVTTPGIIVAGLTEKLPVDVDIHLLSELSGGKCIARGDKNVVEHIAAGVYYLSVDTFSSAANAGAYTVNVTFFPDSGNCGLKTGVMKRINAPNELAMPATGSVVKEAHLVTTKDQNGNTSWWPSTATDALPAHKARTATMTGINYTRTENWAPAGEGGSKYGQGSTGRAIPEDAEAWYVCMYWAASTRPAAGTRYLIINPANGKTVVAAAGYETGPGEGTKIGGAVEEVHQSCGTGHNGILTFAELRNQKLAYGPIDCSK